MIHSIDGFQQGVGNGLSVIPNVPEILFMLEFPVFDLGHFFGLGFSLLSQKLLEFSILLLFLLLFRDCGLLPRNFGGRRGRCGLIGHILWLDR